MGKWQTRESLRCLIQELVRYKSISGSQGEIDIAHYLRNTLEELPYFQTHQSHLQLHPTDDGRFIVTALAKQDGVKETVVLLHHFDVVDVEDYGTYKDLAFHSQKLTELFYSKPELLPSAVKKDVQTGDWLFGRGIMDMKSGMALHMQLLEKATEGAFSGNVLLLSVCDEEVGSAGMLAAAPVLLQLAAEHNLTYVATINSEPGFARYLGDEANYIYSGSLGKVLAGVFCCGLETHAGEPFAGLNANLMAAAVTRELELNTTLCEKVGEEITQPPTCLQQYDLRNGYSVQTPHKAATLFNVFLLEKRLEQITEELKKALQQAAASMMQDYRVRAEAFAAMQGREAHNMEVTVLTFEELMSYAVSRYGAETVAQLERKVMGARQEHEDERDVTVRFLDELTSLCKELAPMMVLFFAPPYYPAVHSKDSELVQQTVKKVISYAREQNVALRHLHYFTGLSDLSYVGPQPAAASLATLVTNMPLYGQVYSLPLSELQQLQMPVLNIGPIGRDAHKWTERLDATYAETVLPKLLQHATEQLFKQT